VTRIKTQETAKLYLQYQKIQKSRKPPVNLENEKIAMLTRLTRVASTVQQSVVCSI